MANIGEKLTPAEIQVSYFYCNSSSCFFTHLEISCRRLTFVVPIFQAMIDEADVDGDGQINYEEFYNMMT